MKKHVSLETFKKQIVYVISYVIWVFNYARRKDVGFIHTRTWVLIFLMQGT